MKTRNFILSFIMMMFCSLAFGQNNYHWSEPSGFENSASMTCVIKINGTTVTDARYELGAFCGDELRGRQLLSDDRYYLTFHGQAGDAIIFKLYDHETNEVMDIDCATNVEFVINGTYGKYSAPFVIEFQNYVAEIAETGVKYATLAEAVTAATDGQTIKLLWSEGKAPIAMNASLYGKDITITGTATVDWSKGFLFVGRGGEGNATLTFNNANLTSASNSASYGIHVSGREKNTNNKYDGTVIINNSNIELDYLINKGAMTMNASKLTVKNGFAVGGRPASETESGADATATIALTNASKLVVNNHNGMGLGYEAIGIMNIDNTSSFETTQSFLVTGKGTMNIAGTAVIAGTLTNNGTIALTATDATLGAQAGLTTITTTVENCIVIYENNIYKVAGAAAKIAETGVSYKTLQEAINACAAGNNTIVLLADNSEDITVVQKEGINVTIDGGEITRFDYSGTFTIYGQSRSDGAETLTFQNINFVTDKAGHYFIDSNSTASAERYAHNVTVENCNFTATGAGVNSAVAMRIRQGFDIAINGGTFTNLHSALQAYGNAGIAITGITVNGKNGISAGTSTDVVIDNSTITATGYGVRADGTVGTDEPTMTMTNNDISANLPVVVRNTNAAYYLMAEGNTFDALNGNNDVTFTTGDDEAEFVAPKDTDAKAVIKDEVTTFGFEAIVNNVYYTTFDKAYAAAQKGNTITVLNQVVITENKTYDKEINVTGATASQMFRIQNGANVVVKNANITNNSHYVFVLGEANPTETTTAGNLTIESGKFHGATTVASVTKGNLVIEGGEFSVEPYQGSYAYLINCFDANYKNSTANVEIKGGKFHRFNPEDNAAEGEHTNFCPEGYIAVYDAVEDVYTVQEGLIGKGTEDEPFIIRNLRDLTFFRDHVNAGETKYNRTGVYVALGDDIDMTGVNWSVNIGDDANATFDGIFDGKNHTISNLNSTETAQKADGYICTGLFGAIAGDAVVKNFTIENVTINTGEFTGNNVSAVVGFAWSATGSIENVSVIGDININAPKATGVGAIVGYAYGGSMTVKECQVVATNNNFVITGAAYVGGIIGYASASELNENTVENISVTGTGSVGAIAGIMNAGGSADKNTVKNVALTTTGELWANSAAVVAGTITSQGAVTVANTTVENVTANGVDARLVGGKLVEKPTTPIEKVEARIGNKYYATFEGALAAAGDNEEITLLVPYTVEAGETLEINKKVVYTSDVLGEAMITNNGTLTITGSVSYTYTGAQDASYSKGNYTINNYGTLTVEGNVVNNTAKMSHASYAINNMSNATTTINSGKVVNAGNYAIRQFASGSNTNTLTINGGEVEGTRAVWMQAAGSNTADAPAIVLNVNGGTLTGTGESGYKLAVYSYSNGNDMKNVAINVANGTINGDIALTGGKNKTNIETVNISGGRFNGEAGEIYSYGDEAKAIAAITISGGTFNTNKAEKYTEDNGYIFEKNADGTYTVNPGTYVARNTTTGQGYVTLQAAVDAAEAGHTIELLQDITLTGGYANDAEAGLGIELPGNAADGKGLTIEGKGHTIDCGTYTKGIRIYNNITGTPPIVTFNDITIVNNNTYGRCIDTRSGNINLKVNGTNLVATKGNSQPLTIGGTEKIHRVSLGDNTKIDAGESGYGVICFVSTNVDVITSGNTTINGYAAFYVKGDALDVQLDLGQGVYTGKNIHSGESNAFGTIVLEGNNTMVKMIGTNPTINAIAEGTATQAAFLVLGENNTISIESQTAKINPQGENAYWAMIDAEVAASTIIRYGEIVGEETVYTRVYPAAEADGFQFMSLEEAIRYAKDTVKVVNANTVANPIIVEKDLTLNLNGKAITAAENVYPVIRIQKDANVTVTGEGSITNATDYVFVLGEANPTETTTAGNLTIENGTYVGATTVASVTKGALAIEGGDFSLVEGTTDYRYLINCIDANYNDNSANVAITGGTFHNWNPENNAAEGAGTNFCAPGYIAVENPAGVFTVQEGAWQAQIVDGAKFQKLEDAIAAAGTTTATINVLSSFETEVSYTIAAGQNITLNLNGKTITGTDKTSKNFGLIQNNGTLTVKGEGALKLAATVNSGWNRYSAVISNNPGAALTVEGGTIEHLGGTDMAYGIDALTNGNLGDVNTTINGGTILSTYSAIRQFLNSDSKENNLVINGGTIEGVNKALFFHDPSKKANNGSVVVGTNAVVNGDVYLFVTDGSLVWPVNVSIAESALNGQLTSANVPNGYVVEERDGIYSVYGKQRYEFVNGWNWFSTYLNYGDISVFQNALDGNAEQIKSQLSFNNYANGVWSNNLSIINVKQTYMVKTAETSFDIITDKVANAKDETITIIGKSEEGAPRWTWIGYPLGTGIAVSEAFKNPNEGDYVKSQEQFAFYEDGKWYGSLKVMNPGEGFMYKNVGNEKQHTYPTSVSSSKAALANVTTENNYWAANSRMYPTNMTMIAVLNVDGIEMQEEFEVAAFCNGEVRGSARPIYVESIDRYMLFMTIHGENNDEITFKYYDVVSEEEYAINDRIIYSENATLGSIAEPEILNYGTLNVDEMSADMIKVYPNPTTTNTAISFETTCDMVEVFNSLGVKVVEYRNVDSIDGLESAGVYVIRVTNGSTVQNCRLIVK